MTYTISIEGTNWYISGIDKKQLNRTLDALFEKGYSPINDAPNIIITKHESGEK